MTSQTSAWLKTLADKRIRDYKQALSLRDIFENNSRGSMAWILQQDEINHEVHEARFDFVKEFANKVSLNVVKTALDNDRDSFAIPMEVPFSDRQFTWLNGYYNGLRLGVMSAGDNTAAVGKPLTIIYGTQTGNSEGLSQDCAELQLNSGSMQKSKTWLISLQKKLPQSSARHHHIYLWRRGTSRQCYGTLESHDRRLCTVIGKP